MHLGDLDFEVKHSSRALGCLTESDQSEHPLEVCPVRLAHLGKRLLVVVALIRQAKPVLFEEHHVPLGVTRVVVNEQPDKAANTRAFECTHGDQQ